MCCRYWFDEDTEQEVFRLAGGGTGPYVSGTAYRMKEIRPTDPACILVGKNGKTAAESMRWGFEGRDGKPVINARSETAAEKPMFSGSLEERRCAVPASKFWEWDRTGQKTEFSVSGRSFIFIAGLYRRYEDGRHFTILTAEANESMKKYHDRMPVILTEEMMIRWLFDRQSVREIFGTPGPELIPARPYEQMSFFI